MPGKTAAVPAEHLEILRQSGGRVTPIVTALLQRLYAEHRTYSPQQIKDALAETLRCPIGFPTIYRAIDRLMRCRLIHRMHRDDGQSFFFVCRKPCRKHHHHFICTACSRVFEIDMCLAHRYESHVSKYLDASITNHITQLEGICKDCRTDTSPKRRTQ